METSNVNDSNLAKVSESIKLVDLVVTEAEPQESNNISENDAMIEIPQEQTSDIGLFHVLFCIIFQKIHIKVAMKISFTHN